MTLRIGFIGCVKSSRALLEVLISMPEVDVCAIVTKQASKVNADFSDLTDICQLNSIPYHYESVDQRGLSAEFLENYQLDLIYCFGWSYLLDDTVLSIPKIGVIGFHPAQLPKNRGRHPIIWALALGLKETASTFFKMDSFADSGPIISQHMVDIMPDDKASDLYQRILDIAAGQVRIFTLQFFNQQVKFIIQDNAEATYWRKRDRTDGLIDWRMSAQGIYNLVRALAPPYPCAEFKIGSTYIKVPKCSVVLGKYPENIEPGSILAKSSDSLLVKVEGSDAVLLEKLEINFAIDGDYL
jgi:methionyl-tRNA formyltransferase